MNQLLVWSLPSGMSLQFICEVKDLASITCCDKVSIVAKYNDVSIELAVGLKACDLAQLQKTIESIGITDSKENSCLNVFVFSRDQFDNVLMSLYHNGVVWSFQVIASDVVMSWALQLDLLHVLMEENEKEQEARGKGCCG